MNSADQFSKKLKALSKPEEAKKYNRYFKTGKGEYGEGDIFIGVSMGQVFNLAKESIDTPAGEIEKMLESPVHEIRAGACSIMSKQFTTKRTSDERRKELYELYLRRHDRINNWDLVDLCAYKVVGNYLFNTGKSRKILYKLAKSKNMWERRTAIVSTLYFLGKDDFEDALKIAEMLLTDKEDLVHKGIGWVLRGIGEKNRPRLLKFLDKHAATMPRTALRYALEHFNTKQRKYYMDLAKNKKIANKK